MTTYEENQQRLHPLMSLSLSQAIRTYAPDADRMVRAFDGPLLSLYSVEGAESMLWEELERRDNGMER